MQTNRPTHAPSANRGFTLLELMLVVTIAAVILGIGVPNMRQFILNNRMTGAANDLLAAIYAARSESVKRRIQTVVCFSSDPEADQPPCDGDGRQGWAVFVDNDGDGQADAGDTVLLRHGSLPDTIAVKGQPDATEGYLAFNASGFAREIGAWGPDLTGVVLCDSRGNVSVSGGDSSAARGLIISATGRPQITRSVTTIDTNASLNGCP